ncbi:DUF550 domain-containing protein [Salmonella enterica subsp. enterica serovar Reading]|nr:DUF550 domain-containing protein [Salmonella enterica subsp. enterica serovar Reading]
MGIGCAFDAETASTCKEAVDSWAGEWNKERLPGQEEYKTVPLYTVPPASERERIRREHAEWSDATFGDISPIGPLKHLSKEALEAAAEPDDLSEWADMQFLLWDAQRRAGITDEQITQAMTEKLAINKTRQWPEPKDGEPRLHIKEHPVPVMPDECPAELLAFCEQVIDSRITANAKADELWNACRAAMLQAGNHTEQHLDMVDHSGYANEKGSDGTFIDEGTKQAGNSPVIPDRWISCSEQMPENGQECLVQTSSGWRYVSFYDAHSRLFYDSPKGDIEYILVTHWMPMPETPKQENI